MIVTRRLLVLAFLVALASGMAFAARAGDPAPDIRLGRPGGGDVDLAVLLGSGPVLAWFPDVASVTEESVAPLSAAVRDAEASLLVIPVVGQDPSGELAELASRFPDLVLLQDPDGLVTLRYTGEFIPGVSPRQNLFVITARGQVGFVRSWPGIPEATLRSAIRSAR